MKLAISVILALLCTLAVADVKVCPNGETDAASYWDGKTCQACPTGCVECVWSNNAVSCINCDLAKGKFLKVADNGVGTCEACVANCQDCKGPAAADCITPNAGYKVGPSGIFKCSGAGCLYCSADDKCAKCELGNRFDSAAASCTACTSGNCAECPDAISTCKKCQFNSALNKDNSCDACQAGCTSCPCKDCFPGFGMNKGDAKLGCARCSDNHCNACTANNEKCTACNAQFGAKDGACVACPAMCDVCDGTGTCTTCQAATYISADKKSCTACGASCTSCGTDGTCTACAAGTFMNTDKKACTKCTDNCNVCKDATTCTTCIDGSLLNGKGECVSARTCKVGESLELKDGVTNCAVGTIDNCVYGMAGNCFTCALGYYANGKVCTSCPSGCKQCSLSKGLVQCQLLAEKSFSIVTANGKADSTGYSKGNVAKTTNNVPTQCMPNNLLTVPLQNPTNQQCNAYDNCPYPTKQGTSWMCYMDGKGNNAVKVTVSLFAMVVVAIFAL